MIMGYSFAQFFTVIRVSFGGRENGVGSAMKTYYTGFTLGYPP